MRTNDHRTHRGLLAVALATAVAAALPAGAALVSVNLGIYGGRAIDLATYVGSGGATRIVAAVEGDIGGVRLNDAGTRWRGLFFGKPGTLAEVEADVTDSGVGSGAGVVYALSPTGKLQRNASEVSGPWSTAGWSTVTGGGTFYDSLTNTVLEGITTIEGHASGTYVGTEDGNVYRSTDGGLAWSLLASPGSSVPVDSIAVYEDDPTNPSFWVVVDSAGTPALHEVTYSGSYSVGSAMTVTGSGGVFERVFVYPSTGISEAPLLFVTGNSPSQAVYRGVNDGASWTTVTYPMHYFQQMRFDAVNDRIYAASGVSDDRGLSFAMMPNLVRVEGEIHTNDGTMAIDPNDASRVYYGTDWFVGEYTESAGSWTAAGEVIDAEGVTAVLINDMFQIADTAATKDTFVIGGKVGLGITSDFLTHSGAHPTWTYPVYPGDDGAPIHSTHLQDYDGDGSVIENVFAGNNGGKLYRSTSQGLTAASYAQVFDVATDAASYTVDSDRVTVADIVESTTSQDDMWIAFGDWDFGNIAGGIACSTDNGATWQVDPAWVTFGDSMKVNTLLYTNTKFWAGVGKYDDGAAAHQGLYAKIGALGGCGAGTWQKQTTSTDIDTSIVYDIDGPTTSPIYVAASSGLFRGELSGSWSYQELTGSADPELAELPSGMNDEYVAVAHNPSPSGYDEEFYAATGDEIYRVRLASGVWTVDLISPSPHEDVNVLLWDALVVGSGGGVTALGAVSKDLEKCATSVLKARTNYVRNVTKAMAKCRDGYVAGGPSCPDAKAASVIAKAAGKIAFGSRCDDDAVAQLVDVWTGACTGVETLAELEACTLADGEAAAEDAVAAEYGDEDPGRVGVAAACQSAIGSAYGGRGYLAKALKAVDKCARNVARDRSVDCPDASAASQLDKAAQKAAAKVAAKCSLADVGALDALGFGGSCSGLASVADLQMCMAGDHDGVIADLYSPLEDAD